MLTGEIAAALDEYQGKWKERERVAPDEQAAFDAGLAKLLEDRRVPEECKELRNFNTDQVGAADRSNRDIVDESDLGPSRRGVRRPAERLGPRLCDGPQHPPVDLSAQRPHPRRRRPAQQRDAAGDAGRAERSARLASADARRHGRDRARRGAVAAARTRGVAGGAVGGRGPGGGRRGPRAAQSADLGEDAGADRPGRAEAGRLAGRGPGHHRARGAAHGSVHPDVSGLRPAAAARSGGAPTCWRWCAAPWRWWRAAPAGKT